MAGRLTLSAVVGVVVIGVVSANANTNARGASSAGGTEGSSASASAGRKATGTHDPGTKNPGMNDLDANDPGPPQGHPQKKVSLDGDGDFRVGRDIEPGTYRSRGNTDGLCHWARAENASGDTDSPRADDHVRGTGYVTVEATDRVFTSSGCKAWEAVDAKAQGSPAAPATPATPTRMSGDGGMYKVGVDIAPGTYTSTGNTDDGCHWERARDAEHGPHSVLAAADVTGTAVVTISTRDAYFTTAGCQDWTKTA
ncbi:hypothetical protein [Streptomyces sp. NPDC090083]|uniref:hypothetical protein n=1 Tax=Streptomyces sp. NPDC090083 TaxID=3365941 RepID=UPI0037F5A7D4